MFQIREAHLQAFSRAKMEDFEPTAIKYFRETFPEKTATLSDAALLKFVRETIPHAARYGIDSEEALLCFGHIRMVLGDALDTDEQLYWLRTLLQGEGFDQEPRAQLARRLVDRWHRGDNSHG
jgi:hypothetical protein